MDHVDLYTYSIKLSHFELKGGSRIRDVVNIMNDDEQSKLIASMSSTTVGTASWEVVP